LPGPAGSGRGTVLVKDATASPHSKARQIFVTFHDTLPSRGPTQPTIGLTVISGYGAERGFDRLGMLVKPCNPERQPSVPPRPESMKFPVFSLLAGNLAFSETSSQLTPSVWGMNVGGIPFSDSSNGFWVVAGVIAAIFTLFAIVLYLLRFRFF
jgi:hypothetical protein